MKSKIFVQKFLCFLLKFQSINQSIVPSLVVEFGHPPSSPASDRVTVTLIMSSYNTPKKSNSQSAQLNDIIERAKQISIVSDRCRLFASDLTSSLFGSATKQHLIHIAQLLELDLEVLKSSLDENEDFITVVNENIVNLINPFIIAENNGPTSSHQSSSFSSSDNTPISPNSAPRSSLSSLRKPLLKSTSKQTGHNNRVTSSTLTRSHMNNDRATNLIPSSNDNPNILSSSSRNGTNRTHKTDALSRPTTNANDFEMKKMQSFSLDVMRTDKVSLCQT